MNFMDAEQYEVYWDQVEGSLRSEKVDQIAF